MLTIEELKLILPEPSISKIAALLNQSISNIKYYVKKPIIGEKYCKNFVNYNEIYELLKNYDKDTICKLNKKIDIYSKYYFNKIKHDVKLIDIDVDYLKEIGVTVFDCNEKTIYADIIWLDKLCLIRVGKISVYLPIKYIYDAYALKKCKLYFKNKGEN